MANVNKIKKNIVALDIGASSVKIAVGDFIKEELQIHKIISSPLSDNTFSDGRIANMDVLVDTVKHMLRSNKLKQKNCFCSLESSQIITREVTIPSAVRENLQDMARFEVEQFLPVDMDNYMVESTILREIEIDEKPFAEMLVTAVPKQLIEQMHTLIADAGMRPLVFDTKANAFGKLIENQTRINGNDYYRESTSAFIDLGHESIGINIFQKGKFKFNRIMNVGGKDLDINISKFLDIEVDDARKKKLSINNINYVVDEMSKEARMVNIVRSTLTNWLEEINKIFRYYNTRNVGINGVEYIYIYGGLSKINGLSDFFESHFKIPTDTIRKLDKVTIDGLEGLDISEVLNTISVMYRRQVQR